MSGESHRIYWQQWASNDSSSSSSSAAASTIREPQHIGVPGHQRSRRELITSSAAVRITSHAKAKDVTSLLQQSLRLDSSSQAPDSTSSSTNASTDDGDLVLVGTLFSLPPHYVIFDHERQRMRMQISKEQQERSLHKDDDEASVRIGGSYEAQRQQRDRAHPSPLHHRSDPFHVVQTLQPNENPLVVRDRMVERLRQLQQLAPSHRTIISPKLQFFYVHTNGNNPSCVELDGYSTSMEDEEDETFYEDECDHDDALDGHDLDDHDFLPSLKDIHSEMIDRFPWLAGEETTSHSLLPSEATTTSVLRIPADIEQRRRERQYREYLVHSTSSTPSGSTCLSGYLSKQSRDPHVWRRVHCLLTEDRLWFVSRIYDHTIPAADGSILDGEEGYSKMGTIRLTRALLMLPDPNSAFPNPALRSAPWAFELLSGKGVSHVFRATSQRAYSCWIQALQSRIVQAGENSLVDHAELILADESIARTKRTMACAAMPLWEAILERGNLSRNGEEEDATPAAIEPIESGPVGFVLRWGLDVAAFRETCKYLHTRLPPKSPVFAQTSTTNSTESTLSAKEASVGSPTSYDHELDPSLLVMIQGSWDQAATLLSRASNIGRHLHSIQHAMSRNLHRNSMLSSIETNCRHVDYVLTGRFRPFFTVSAGEDDGITPRQGGAPETSSHQRRKSHPNGRPTEDDAARVNQHREPPPIDLFEQLLHELQVHAAEAELARHPPSRKSMSAGGNNDESEAT